ncbi:MAG: family 20 glycosylhydrolase [Clostridia bacterium]|nr:family 20 glycosylhydrolase [Clostridia bacterium]
MHLLPKPKKLEIKENSLKSKKVNIKNLIADNRIDKALGFFEQADDGVLLTVSAQGVGEGYTLTISPDEIKIEGNGVAGAFYGIQTLKQIFEETSVPCLEIEDEPDMKRRGFYHDVTRGKVPTVETLKGLIDKMAYYKMNELQLYIEHTFPFKEFGDDVEKFGYLTPSEIKEIDDYCYDNFIEHVPSIATFGHLFELLAKPEYRHLQTVDNYEPDRIFWMERMAHHTIDPKNPESIEIIKSLIDQVLPLFRSDRFNICGDETFDLKEGKYKGEDTGKLYVDFIKKIIAHLKSKGKKIMMWGDVLLQHPEVIPELPKDIQLANWYYSENPPEETFETFEKSGCEQIVCPGTSAWIGFTEDVIRANQNIIKMCDLGYKHGATGMLNTNWGDFGHLCSLELSMHGFVLGAAKSWNIETKADGEFDSSINAICYKNENAVKYLTILSKANVVMSWNEIIWTYSKMTMNTKIHEYELPTMEEIEKCISNCQSVIAELKKQTWEIDRYRTEFILAAEGIIIVADILAKLAKHDHKQVSNVAEWLKSYRESWMQVNKESELYRLEKFLTELDAM